MTNSDQANQSNLYLVICGKHIDRYCPERELADMCWNTTVEDIAHDQFSTIRQVIEVGTGADVTEKIAREVVELWAQQGEGLDRWQYEFVESFVGMQAARAFGRTA